MHTDSTNCSFPAAEHMVTLSCSLRTPTAVLVLQVSNATGMKTMLRCLGAYRLRDKSGKRLNFDKGLWKTDFRKVFKWKLQSEHSSELNTSLLPVLPCWVLETRMEGSLGSSWVNNTPTLTQHMTWLWNIPLLRVRPSSIKKRKKNNILKNRKSSNIQKTPKVSILLPKVAIFKSTSLKPNIYP